MHGLKRNPWHDIDAWREFLWDMRHPIHFIRGAVNNVNKVNKTQRRIGAGLMVVGGLNMLVGVLAVIFR